MPGFWMRTLRVEFGTKRIPACLPSREILFREWDGSNGGCYPWTLSNLHGVQGSPRFPFLSTGDAPFFNMEMHFG
jgi:hypothetical protein